MTPKRIHNRSPLNEIHRPAYELLEVVFQLDEVPQAHVRLGCEAHHHVDVALRAKVVAHDGAEQGQLCDLPATAELGKLLGGDAQVWVDLRYVNSLPSSLLKA